MSPIIRQVASRRAFSIISKVREVARASEVHPFARLPVSTPAAKADWAVHFRHLGRAGALYFPALTFFLTWPVMVEYAINGHIH